MTRETSRSPDNVVLHYVRGHQIQSTVFLSMIPVLTLVLAPVGPVAASGLGAGAVAFTACHVAATGMVGVSRIAKSELLAWTGVAVAIPTAVAALLLVEYGWAWLLLPGTAAADLVFVHKSRRPSIWALAVGGVTAAAAFVALLVRDGVDSAWRPALGALAVVFVVCYLESAGPLLWRRTVAAEQVATQLTRTRERLRMSEDLHDILGRALEVVALKSELAARLMTTQPERAQAELAQVQRVARAAVDDVRNLVTERKPVSLDEEIAAAVLLLESAGVRCTVATSADGLPGELDDILGRVVRESVTNILRHSQAANCVLAVKRSGDVVTLAIDNDGLRPRSMSANGSGLNSLRRRLAEHGGALSTQTDQTYFRLRAHIDTRKVL